MTSRARLIVLIGVCVLALGAASAYLLRQRAAHDTLVRNSPTVSRTSLSAVAHQPHIVFRSTALGSKYGMVAEVPLRDPGGSRAFTSTSCDRVYAAAGKVLCLSSKTGLVTTYAARLLDAATMTSLQSLPLSGIPSRARLSRDGRLAATTSFVAGDSYAGTSFSTRTVISRPGGASYGNLESFTLRHNGHVIAPIGRNFWGVTFAGDDRTFYATAEWSGKTWLVRGDLLTRSLVTLHEDAECPSLSPNGTRVAFKQRGSLPAGHWRLVVYTIGSGKLIPLAEPRSVDDQVEWLDDTTVMYGVPRPGTQAATDDVWAVPANGTGHPRLLIPQAWSPAVVH